MLVTDLQTALHVSVYHELIWNSQSCQEQQDHVPNLDALYFHSYYFTTPLCFGSCYSHQPMSSIIIYIPTFCLMFKQLNDEVSTVG